MDFTNLYNADQYDGEWVAFDPNTTVKGQRINPQDIINLNNDFPLVLGQAPTLELLSQLPQMQGKFDYALHYFPVKPKPRNP